jgi:hypothetical protein
MGSVPPRYSIGLWLAAGSLAFLLCLYHLSATLAGGALLPADHDSFYHARRIIDALAAPLQMYQFDPRMHAPEGSWVTWPWAYDMLMAFAARGLMALTGAADPMTVLAFIAPAWVFVNAALFLGVASRLRLSLPAQALAMLFFATSPLTQGLHRVGTIDHHYIEYTFVLATLWLGLAWFREPAGRRHAVALGVVLGAAPAFHNGLFVLQAPVLVALGCLWAVRRPLDPPAVLAFAAALIVSTAAFLLPSEPFRQGTFAYYLHSWFHLYVACCVAALCVLASRLRLAPRNAALIAAAALAMAAPILAQAVLGAAFVFGTLEYLAAIDEVGSVAGAIADGRLWYLTRTYSPLLWALPAGLGWLAWRLRRQADGASIYFLAMAVFGSFLLLQQYRLEYFGSFALILPWCLLFDDLASATPSPRARQLGLAAAIVAAILPGLQNLRAVPPLGGDLQYMLTRPIYPALKAACAARPGVILAEPGDGHYIRFHTECSVIANNFILTPQHVQKIRQTGELLAAPLSDVLARAPYVRYVYVRRVDNVLDDVRGCGVGCPENRGLRMELLSGAPPARLRLLMEVRMPDSQPLARLFEVIP